MELDYKVVFAKRKTLTITVERDRSVVVTAPEGTSLEKVRQVVESRKLWLYEKTRHAQKYNPLPHAPGKELVTGESLLYLGRQYRIELVDDSNHIQFAQKFLVPRSVASKPSLFRTWLMARAEEKILPRVAIHAKNLGVEYKEAKIGDGKYRWGSCTPNDNVIFNWRLIKAPMFVIDYVVVHELAHLIEQNHTPRFWNIVKAQAPTMEKAKMWLQSFGNLLEQDI
ncbi:M48 family metallopeptidase [Niveibacterium microcysteis]|uniref:M48 family metallopeptidase n=1 Tax=Niveibacterium microcysteis TaxID=2811415 RepID=A0ABX7MAN2_9RHOO|nr:SprT family zinc-dependent metalloprotease [Niveibacterium microcysteis]QSI78777.1 M48 family metallopeptidase [Niveibacterium microcysteis]